MVTKQNLLVITDLDESRKENEILESIVRQVANRPISWKALNPVVRFNQERLSALASDSKQAWSKEDFLAEFAPIRDSVDLNQLLDYSKNTNPRLYHNLLRGMNPEEALWICYQESMQGKRLDFGVNYFAIRDEASKVGFPNVLEVLFDHEILAVQFSNPISYHMIGRGFIAEGFQQPIYKDNLPTGSCIIHLPMGLYGSMENQLACANDLINHELIGHALLGLKDHSATEVDPRECLMSIPLNRQEFINLARDRNGKLVFCTDCKKTYKEKIEEKN